MRRKIIVVALCVVGVAALAGGIRYAWLITPPDLPQTAEEGLHTLASPRYQRLPDYRREAYTQRKG